jgi:hypothetical protein
MARKDRERARKRHAIARQTFTDEPRPKPERPARPDKAGSRRAPAKPANPYSYKAKVGDLSPVGMFSKRMVKRTRDMLVHPKITMRVVLVCFVLALPGVVLPWFRRGNLAFTALTFAAFAVSFVGLADLAPTRTRSYLMLLASGMCLVLAVSGLAGAS